MKNLQVKRGAYYLARLIAEGEHETQDFKFAISDACKIARSVSAFANNRGGRLLIGVKDNGVIAGIRNEEDMYVVEAAATLYCRPAQQVDFSLYRDDEGHLVMVAEVAPAPKRPVEARDARGKWQAYYRVADENIAADPLMIDIWRSNDTHDNVGMTLNFTFAEKQLLGALAAGEMLTLKEFALKAHITQLAAHRSATRLLAMGVVRLVHINNAWHLAAAE